MTAEGPSYLLSSSSGIREVFFFSRGVYGQIIFTKGASTRRPALAPTLWGVGKGEPGAIHTEQTVPLVGGLHYNLARMLRIHPT